MSEKYFKIIGLLVYGLILSGIIGVISSVFLILVNGLTDFLWTDTSNQLKVPSIYTLLLCIFGGVLVGVSRYKWGNLPKTANDAIVELKTTQRINYSYIYQFINCFFNFNLWCKCRSCSSHIKFCYCIIGMAGR